MQGGLTVAFLQKLRCRLGSHQWEGWRYVQLPSHDPGDLCRQERTCSCCHIRETRSVGTHVWGEWKYCGEDSCKQEQVCNRCQARREQESHMWGAWKSIGDSRAQRICSRCHSKEIRDNSLEISAREETSVGHPPSDTRIERDPVYGHDKDVSHSQRSENSGLISYD